MTEWTQKHEKNEEKRKIEGQLWKNKSDAFFIINKKTAMNHEVMAVLNLYLLR